VWIKPTSKDDQAKKPKCQDISSPLKTEDYLVLRTYKAKSSSEISITKGSKVSVIEKNFNGWWLIDTKDGQGKLNDTYIKEFLKLI